MKILSMLVSTSFHITTFDRLVDKGCWLLNLIFNVAILIQSTRCHHSGGTPLGPCEGYSLGP